MKTIEERESDSDFSEFSETCIEREYKSMNLNPTFSKRNSFNITLTPTFKNIFNILNMMDGLYPTIIIYFIIPKDNSIV